MQWISDPEMEGNSVPLHRRTGKRRATRLWSKVATMALNPGSWSPRPEAPHLKAAFATPSGEGFPSLADPYGLLDPDDTSCATTEYHEEDEHYDEDDHLDPAHFADDAAAPAAADNDEAAAAEHGVALPTEGPPPAAEPAPSRDEAVE